MAEERRAKFFYGYRIVAITFFIMMFTWGMSYTFGIFFKPVLTEFGWTRAATSGAFTLSIIVFGLASVVTGRINDRFGPRLVTTACGLLLSSGFLLMSRVTAIWQLYLFYGILVGIGLSGSYVPAASTVTRWFTKRRGLMTGIMLSGVGFSQLVMSPLANWLILEYGWRTSYVIIGFTTLVVVVSLAQFYKRDPGQLGLLPYGHDDLKGDKASSQAVGLSLRVAIRTRQFWILCIMFSGFGLSLQAILGHIVAHATDLSISATSAANILAIIGGVSLVSRFSTGHISDRIGGKKTAIFCYSLVSAALLWLLIARETWMLYLFAVIFGVAYGGWGILLSVLTAELFGLGSLGIILGAIMFFISFGEGAGPVIAGGIFDIAGSYQPAFILIAALNIAATILAFFLRPVKDVSQK